MLKALLRQPLQLNQKRFFQLISSNNSKIIERTSDTAKNVVTIQGKYLPNEPNKQLKYKHEPTSACAFCKLEKMNIYVQHTDVIILRQFLRDDGSILPTSVTGLCWKQQKKLMTIVKQAKEAGLLTICNRKLISNKSMLAEVPEREADLKWNRYYEVQFDITTGYFNLFSFNSN
jgi:ribosomal protein S18